jgi:type IV secretion system protein VirD4
MKKFPTLPRLDPDQPTASPLATSRWQSSESVKEALRYDENSKDDNGSIILGHIDDEIMAFNDDRHVTTFGGSRAGKGDSLVLPNLLTYKGSVICIDPKGENASVSAKWRSEVLGQKVYVLDPFRVAKVDAKLRKSLNPLEFLDLEDPEIVDDVSAIAEATIIPGNGKDPHWDETAKAFIKGVMLFILAKGEIHE